MTRVAMRTETHLPRVIPYQSRRLLLPHLDRLLRTHPGRNISQPTATTAPQSLTRTTSPHTPPHGVCFISPDCQAEPRHTNVAAFVAAEVYNLARSPSPSKIDRNEVQQPSLSEIAPMGQKFVPHWRRALPTPGHPAGSPPVPLQPQQVERRSTVSGPVPPPIAQRQGNAIRPLPQSPAMPGAGHGRSSSSSVHPLPPLPSAAPQTPAQSNSPPRRLPQPNIPRAARPGSSSTINSGTDSTDSEDLASHVLLSRPQTRPPVNGQRNGRQSPQYGILDMPSRMQSSANGSAEAQSVTLRLASMSVQDDQHGQTRDDTVLPNPGEQSSRPPSRTHGYSQSVPNASSVVLPHPMPPMTRTYAQSGVTRWPAGLPPLPKAPASNDGGGDDPSRRPGIFGRSTPTAGHRPPILDLSLDDAPPPSLRRSPSPARSAAQSAPRHDSPSPFDPYRTAPASRSTGGRPQPASIRTQALNGTSGGPVFSTRHELPSPSRSRAESPVSATTPSSAVSAASAFTLSAFPRPPSSTPPSSRSSSSPRDPQSAGSAVSPLSAVSPASANSTSSAFTLSSFPQPPSQVPSDHTFGRRIVGPSDQDRRDGGGFRQAIPKISFPASGDDDDSEESDSDFGPVISVSGPGDHEPSIPSISIGPVDDTPDGLPQFSMTDETTKHPEEHVTPLLRAIRKGPGLTCGGCGGAIVGRTVSAMGARWHPGCFRCCVCNELLEHLSSYEHEGRAYCGLDYHERFAPRCYHCKTVIVDERFITLDDPELGKRTYHDMHFFCAECGDPFLAPSASSRAPAGGQTFSGDGIFSGGEDDVGFTVYRGHPYCEACHVRLRLPKCKRCKKAIRDGKRAVEALGGKWCWECFVCASCERPFDNPAFFQRDGKPFCEHCFSIMIKNEM
ncbi:hypothetical protein IEO21_03995 [Rhodonia placenta]|uniref:LIM zinc-binding domain-containing protein n=1 Tax=Rhodonia placenta TaxID=104341 RepID=A0A8H7P4U5_9APHY|nr:hypothetical protein IEO21_03995 [Postia placenta]